MSTAKSWQTKISALPSSPGVYRFLNADKEIIYIGKAKNLRARVKQYFAGADERPQIPFLMREAADFDYTVVSTELESLYLERTLIQKHHPKYNIELKDDKNYAFIKIDYSTEIPQVVIKRRLQENDFLFQTNHKSKIINHKSDFFGPFTSAKKIRDLIFLSRRTFGLCSALNPPAGGGKACFYYHLHRCPGVCAGIISVNEYYKHLEKIKLLFSGKTSFVRKTIEREMRAAARSKKFEKAARLRDQLNSLRFLEERQNVILPRASNLDIVGLAFDESLASVNLFKIRSGKMLDKENFIYEYTASENFKAPEPEILSTFLEDYYSQTSDVPKIIDLPAEPENAALIQKLVFDRFRKPVKIRVPKKGKTLELVKLSRTNAGEYLKNFLNEKAGHLDKVQRGLAQLREVLSLPKIPERIEGFDISNIQGTNPVGSMVVFEDGLPKKSEYRKFKILGGNTPNDFEMMREMLARRITRSVIGGNFQFPPLRQDFGGQAISNFQKNPKSQILNSKPWELPDLIVIDGGKGQLNAALSALQATHYKLPTIPIIGLAKRIEEIFLPGKKQPIILSHDQPGLQLLQRLRDEAHRFGITFHRQLRSKQAVRSALDNIVGVGPKTKKLLKQKFGTVAEIKKATLDELKAVVGEKLAAALKQQL